MLRSGENSQLLTFVIILSDEYSLKSKRIKPKKRRRTMKKGTKKRNLPREAKREMLALTQQQKNDVEITEGCIKDVEREWLVCPTGKGFSNIVSVATKGKNVNSTFELDGTINSEVYKSENLRRELMNVRAFTDTDNQLSFAFEDTMKNEDEYFRCVIRNFDNFWRERRDNSTLKNLIFL